MFREVEKVEEVEATASDFDTSLSKSLAAAQPPSTSLNLINLINYEQTNHATSRHGFPCLPQKKQC